MQDALEQRYALIDELLTGTFNSVLRIEERVLENKLTRGLTITEIHAIVAVGYRESNPMNVVAARLGVTLATLTTTAARLEEKGYVVRTRDESDRRKVLISLTTRGRRCFAPTAYSTSTWCKARSRASAKRSRRFSPARSRR